MSDYLLYGLVGLMFYQSYATVRVVRHDSYASEKKWHQLLIIWLIPFFGAAIALARLTTDSETPVHPDRDVVPKKPNNRAEER
jgi:hypothetical protein